MQSSYVVVVWVRKLARERERTREPTLGHLKWRRNCLLRLKWHSVCCKRGCKEHRWIVSCTDFSLKSFAIHTIEHWEHHSIVCSLFTFRNAIRVCSFVHIVVNVTKIDRLWTRLTPDEIITFSARPQMIFAGEKLSWGRSYTFIHFGGLRKTYFEVLRRMEWTRQIH